eukprot:6265368-Alexandrium_andersonii.AAC.1
MTAVTETTAGVAGVSSRAPIRRRESSVPPGRKHAQISPSQLSRRSRRSTSGGERFSMQRVLPASSPIMPWAGYP